MTTNIFSLLIVLGVLVFIHELGHFLVARFFDVGVEKFSLGFGPKIFGKTIGLTDYRVSAIPLGGYVKMVGEEPDAEIEPEMLPYSFTHKSVYKRMLIVAAGPVFNIILAVAIFWGLFSVYGTFEVESEIGKVVENSPAYHAGLQPDDLIVEIDGAEIHNWSEMAAAIKKTGGREVEIIVERHGNRVVSRVKPEMDSSKNIFGEDIEKYMIGVASSGKTIPKKLGIFSAFTQSIQQTYAVVKITFLSIVKMVQGTVSKKELGGPIMIAKMAGDQARVGISSLISFIAIISINLAILNFLPIPVLDGGHLLFFLIEAVKGSPVKIEARMKAQQVGMLLLLFLMVFVFYNDLARIFSS